MGQDEEEEEMDGEEEYEKVEVVTEEAAAR